MDKNKKEIEEENKSQEVSQEEQDAENEALKEVKDDELREKIAEDLGIDPDDEDQSDLLDKVVEKERLNREKLSGAIKQKIAWRERAELPKKPKVNPEEGNTQNQGTPDVEQLVDQKLNEKLEERDLQSLNLPEEVETEVRELAKLKGISIREASQLPYILNRKEAVEKEARIKNATPTRSKTGSYKSSIDPSKPLDPKDFDFNSEEGVKAWKEAKAAREKYMAQK
jgi:hypothetical protein